ncbi:MAG: hypothetical protein IKS23_01925 [Alphaproteobacteria bacterium]|nr:hypothetical protein [Alphaproteobacteria bacterium]
MRRMKTLKETLIKMLSKQQIREQICEMLINDARNGNLKAVELIRDITGEKNNPSAANIEQVTNIKIEVVDAKGTQD